MLAVRNSWQPCTTAAAWQGQQQQRQQHARRQQQQAPLRAAAGSEQPPLQQQQQQQAGSPPSSSDTFEFTYLGSDGRVKATFEQAFKNMDSSSGPAAGSSSASSGPAAPWALGYQMSERYSMLWNDDLKARLLKRVAADELGIADEDLEARLERVQLLLPDIRQKLRSMRPQLVAKLAAEADNIPGRLLQLKLIFPEANTSLLAMRQPELVLGFDLTRLEGIAGELREMLPNLNIDRLVEENPSMLDVAGLRAAMEEARRIMPQLDVQKAMATDPQLIFSFQRGNQLIPYDSPRPEQDDDEYGQYYG